MPSPRPLTSLERVAPWIAGLLIALPVVVFHYPPMADVPMHEAVVGLLRHWGDPSYVPAGLYDLNLGLGNQLFYFLILPLAYVAPIGVATKLVVAITLFALPPATARLADHLSVTRWSAVIIAPLGLGWLFFWGLLSNLMGLDVYLLMLPALDRLSDRPTPKEVAKVCAWMVLIHFTHDLMMLVAAGTLVVFAVSTWRGWRENLVRVLPVALAAVLALTTTTLATRLLNKRHVKLLGYGWTGIDHKLRVIPSILFGGSDRGSRLLILFVCAVPTILFAVERWRTRDRKAQTGREAAHHFRFEIVGVLLVLGYLVAPIKVNATTLVYQRFLPPAWILLTVTACTRAPLDRPWRLPRMLAAFVPFAPLLTAWPTFAANGRLYSDLDATITHMDRNSSYIVVELGPDGDSGLVAPANTVGHVVAALGGRSFHDFTSSEIAPVYQRREAQWITAYDRMNGTPYEMMPSYDLTRFRYALLHTPDEGIANVAVVALAPDARMIFRQGEWTVMESTLPLVPIDALDEPTPTPAPKTLRERCIEAVARIRNARR